MYLYIYLQSSLRLIFLCDIKQHLMLSKSMSEFYDDRKFVGRLNF